MCGPTADVRSAFVREQNRLRQAGLPLHSCRLKKTTELRGLRVVRGTVVRKAERWPQDWTVAAPDGDRPDLVGAKPNGLARK